jgi:DNA polymerase-3 subunit epsilon
MFSLLRFEAPKRRNFQENEKLISDASFTVIDTELTGLNERKDSIVSVGAVRMTGSRIFPGDAFYRLIRPKTALTGKSVVIHGITPSDVAGERNSAPVLEEFAAFCEDSILVGHFVCIDIEFINREMKRVMSARLDNQLLDTAELFRWMRKRKLLDKCCPSPPRETDLYKLANSLDITVSETHHALVDAFITAQLLQRFLCLFASEGILTVGDLMRIGDPLEGEDRLRSAREMWHL